MDKSRLDKFISCFASDSSFDVETIQTLIEDTNESTVLSILANFNNTLLQVIENIDVGVSSHDAEKVWQSLHKISGSLLLIGFLDMGHTARELSRQMRAIGDGDALNNEALGLLELLKNLKEKINSNSSGLKDYL